MLASPRGTSAEGVGGHDHIMRLVIIKYLNPATFDLRSRPLCSPPSAHSSPSPPPAATTI